VDIVAAQHALHLLGAERVLFSPLNVGGGMVRCAHGVMPVPAPATALLLRGMPVYGTDGAGELVTPTGAALAVQRADGFGAAPPMRVASVGYGSGVKDLPDRANVLRVLVGEAADKSPADTEEIRVVEAHVDDMTGELIAPVLPALLNAGARDAFVTPVLGKKGRPAQLITVLCDPARLSDIVDALFAHTTTLGVRTRTERRFVLERSWRTVATPWGEVRVKLGCRGGEVSTAAPEFEDCRDAAARAGVPVRRVYEAALAAAAREEFADA
jgi:uncharacterized protein (TIGR00299 family) protein